MVLDPGQPEGTPPLKRRRSDSESLSRYEHGKAEAYKSTALQGASSREASWVSRTGRSQSPNGGHTRDRFNGYSSIGASPRSREQSPPATRSVSRSRSRRRSLSGSVSRSRSRARFDSPLHSRSRSWEDSDQPGFRSRSRSGSRSRSRSLSSDQSQTQARYYSPPPADSTPKKPLNLNYRPRLVLHGHTNSVSQVRISPDGRFIASASADGTIKIWDAATGSHMDTLVGHMAGVSCVAWSPDSNTLASGSDDKAIRLWDRVTGRPKTTTRQSVSGQEMAPLRGHHNYIHCLAFSPKGNILASGSYDEAVFLWDVRAGRLMRSLPAHSDPVSGIDFSRDGTLVVSCSTDGLM